MANFSKQTPFRLNGAMKLTPSKKINAKLKKILEKSFGLSHLDDLYQQLPEIDDEKVFLKTVLDTFNIRYQLSDSELASIPKEGPLIVVANHPFGTIEGVILAEILQRVRDDVKVMDNDMLKRIPELSDLFVSVNPYGTKEAASSNLGPMKKAIRWIKKGGVLVVFQAGDVSRWNPTKGQAMDQPWSGTIAKIIRITGSPVTPVYFHGANSLMFQIMGTLHPRIRTAMLPRELINKANALIPVRIGKTISNKKIVNQGDDSKAINYIRLCTYALRNRPDAIEAISTDQKQPAHTVMLEVLTETPVEHLTFDVQSLPEERCLATSGELSVHIADAAELPSVMREIGRLREITFRATGEGTGNETDIDIYDGYYKHLFVWNIARQELVGAYRLGLADEIYERLGKKGLYTQSLFKYKKKLLYELNPAIELGRSFVRQEYQRSFSPLMLLWKGIGGYLAQNPKYSVLFGPVSISNEYQTVSQQIMVEFLRAHTDDPQLSKHVRPRHPFKGRMDLSCNECKADLNMDGMSDLITSIEPDNKGLPILLKQYLKLGGKILGFNVDTAFNTLDGLIMVDLKQTDPKILAKYMGRDASSLFLEHHNPRDKCA